MTSVPGILVEVPESLPPMLTSNWEEKLWNIFSANPEVDTEAELKLEKLEFYTKFRRRPLLVL